MSFITCRGDCGYQFSTPRLLLLLNMGARISSMTGEQLEQEACIMS